MVKADGVLNTQVVLTGVEPAYSPECSGRARAEPRSPTPGATRRMTASTIRLMAAGKLTAAGLMAVRLYSNDDKIN